MSSVKARRKRAAPSSSDGSDDYPFGYVCDALDGLFQEVDIATPAAAAEADSKRRAVSSASSVHGNGDNGRMIASLRRSGDTSAAAASDELVLSLTNIDRLWQTRLGLGEFKAHV